MSRPTRFTQDMVDEYMAKGYWSQATTSGLWDRNARLTPDKEALIDSRVRLTWRQAKQRSDRIALGFLRMGYQADDLIFVILPNCADSFIVRLACEKAGVLAMTALMTIRESEIEFILKNYAVRGIVIPRQFRNFNYHDAIKEMRPRLPDLKNVFVTGDDVPSGADSLEELTRRPPTRDYPVRLLQKTRYASPDVTVIGLTSGTTGLPKTAEHVMAARMALGAAYHTMPKLTSDDVVINVINAVAGLGAAFCFSQSVEAARTICQEVWNAEDAFRLIQKERANIILCAPAQLAMMVRDPALGRYDLTSLRTICSSTAPLTEELAVEAETKFRVPVTNAYGTFDGGGISITTIDDDVKTRHTTVGKPIRGTEIRVVDENGKDVPPGEDGELWFRGPATTSGYFRDLKRTLDTWGTLGKEGWFHSGDLVRVDGGGHIMITGRIKDVYKRGGQMIYPSEIEELLAAHPRVEQVAVVGMPDTIMGEKGCAYVVPRKGQTLTFEEMKAFLQSQKIAPFKIPERLEIASEIPMRNFKVVKSILRDDVTRKLKAEGKL